MNTNSIRLDLRLLEAAALLHDIAKPISIITGKAHDSLGARMLDEWGYEPLAPIVKDHASLDLIRLHGPITESLIVNYSDKRVRHDQVVTVEDRFKDLVDRYGKTPEHKRWIWEKLKQYQELERKIFDHLTIAPTASELMSLSLDA